MFTGTLANTAGIKKLTLGVTDAQGTRAEMKFVAPDYSPANTAAPLVAVAMIDEYQPLPPTEDEMNEHYLVKAGWQKNGTDQQDGLCDFWTDPLSGKVFALADAFALQERREREAPVYEICRACFQPIFDETELVSVMFPPVASWQEAGDTFFYHRKCYRDDGADRAETRALAFDPGYAGTVLTEIPVDSDYALDTAELEANDYQPRYDPDCPACLRGHDHTAQEHEQALVRNYAASLGDEVYGGE